MATGTRTFTASFVTDTRKFNDGIKKVQQDLGGVQGSAQDADKGVAGLQTSFANLARVAAASGIGLAIKSSIDAASDLNESVNAVNVSFGEAADGVLALGENAARTVGLSSREFNALAVQFNSFASTIAGEGGNVVTVLEELTGRAADFASVMNLDVNEAARLFQSGLAGETEPLRRFGIDLSAASVSAFAYANGIAEAGAELTEQQKVQARYQSLLEQTAKTQGDFANTSDSFANSQRILRAEFQDTVAELGQNFIPVAEALLRVANGLLGAFNAIPGPARDTAIAVGLAAAAVKILGPAATAAVAQVKALGPALATSATGGAALSRGLSGVVGLFGGPWGLALAGGTAALFALNNASETSRRRAQELADTLDDQSGAVTENTREWVANAAAKDGTLDAARNLGLNLEDVTSALLGEAEAIERVQDQLGRYRDASGEVSRSVVGDYSTVVQSIGDYETRLARAREEQDRVKATAELAAEGLGEVEGAADDAARALDDLIDGLSEIGVIQRDGREATANYKQAIDDLTDSIEENGRTLNLNTQEGRDNDAALRTLAERGLQLIETKAREEGATYDAAAAYRQLRRDAIDQAEAILGSRDAAVDYVNNGLGLIPARKTTVVELDKANAERGVDAFLASLARIPASRNVVLNVQRNTQALGGPVTDFGRADGGPVSAFRPYIVGERGQEAFVPGADGYIVATQALKDAMKDGTRSVDNRRVLNVQNLVIQAPDPRSTWEQLESLAVS